MQKNTIKNKNFPTLFFFTSRKEFTNIFQEIYKLPVNSTVIIREYDLTSSERLLFAQKMINIAKPRKIHTIVGKSLEIALKSKADGVHFSDNDQSWRKYLLYKKYNKNFILSCSCHNEKSIMKAKQQKIEHIFISPIFKTNSHPEKKPLGIRRFANINQENQFQINALGGINFKNINKLLKVKTKGIGILSLAKDLQ